MMMQPSPPANTTPWQVRQVGYGMKLLLVLVFLVLTIIAVTSAIMWIFLVPTQLLHGPGPRDTISSMIIGISVLTVVLVVSVFGIIKLYPYVSAPNRFTPSYGQLLPTFTGQPFEVRFQRPRFSRSFRGKGTLVFEPNQLMIDGTLEPSGLFQLLIVVVVTVAPLLLFGIGIGLIPALLLAFLLGKKKMSRVVPYTEVSELLVTGCRVTFSCAGERPNKVALYVSQVDGERLYRELALRFPAALGGWTAQT